MSKIVIASSRDWFDKVTKSKEFLSLDIQYIKKKEDLTLETLEKLEPEYIFFPHWNWRVSKEIFSKYKCVAFHTAPLPYGRGGSPIQNLIIRGHVSSPVFALKMTEVLDGGPIYGAEEISLDGNLDEIFHRIAMAVHKLILLICKEKPVPIEQKGIPVKFQRLTYKDNELTSNLRIFEIYDRIRMVDGLDYPKAYICNGLTHIEFTEAEIVGEEVFARAKFSLKKS